MLGLEIGVCIVLLALIVYLIAIFPDRVNKRSYPWLFAQLYAHRGLFLRNQTVAENSLEAFEKAVEKGYGIELDLQVTSDGKVVVFHDDELKRMCGVEGRPCDYTYEQLQSFPLGQSGQRIPLFTDVLRVVGGKVPMIVEFKKVPDNEELCRLALPLLREYQGNFCVESFDPWIVRWFYKNAPDILRGQLSGRFSKQEYHFFLRKGLEYLFSNVYAHPQFIAYDCRLAKNLSLRLCKGMGAVAVAWTVRSEEEMERTEKLFDVIIFEQYPQ